MAEVEATEAQTIRGVHVEHIERMLEILGERLRGVMEAHLYAETHAATLNRIGRNNLTEALSHLGTFAESASTLTFGEQRDQITHFEDHLRRTLMESFEIVAKYRIGQIDKLWDAYQGTVVPLIADGRLPDVIPPAEADEMAMGVRYYIDQGRVKKRSHSWEQWRAGAACFEEASILGGDLKDKLSYAVGQARSHQDDRRNLFLARIGLGVGVAGVLIGVAVALLAG